MPRRLLSFLRRKPKAEITLVHPHLGPLKYVEGIWYGQAPSNPEIEIAVIGTEQGPDEKQTERLIEHLAHFESIEHQTHDFLEGILDSDPVIKANDFQIRSLDFLWPKEESYFMVYMKMKGDEYSDWRVEFVNGHPKFLGRDD